MGAWSSVSFILQRKTIGNGNNRADRKGNYCYFLSYSPAIIEKCSLVKNLLTFMFPHRRCKMPHCWAHIAKKNRQNTTEPYQDPYPLGGILRDEPIHYKIGQTATGIFLAVALFTDLLIWRVKCGMKLLIVSQLGRLLYVLKLECNLVNCATELTVAYDEYQCIWTGNIWKPCWLLSRFIRNLNKPSR